MKKFIFILTLMFAVTSVSVAAETTNFAAETTTVYKKPAKKKKPAKRKVSSQHSWKNVSTGRTCNKKKRK
jgi:hypothetical protein